MLVKLCTCCHKEKATDQFLPSQRGKLGVGSWCRPCDLQKSRERYAKNQKKYSAQKTRYAETHKLKIKEYHVKWYYRNHEKKLLQNAQWSAKNKERHRELTKSWQKSNPAKVNTSTANYRALKTKSAPKWLSAIELAQIQEMYDIALARSVQTGVEHHVDHIHPLRGNGFNGLHVPWNLRVITAYENRVKSNKLSFEDMNLAWGVR